MADTVTKTQNYFSLTNLQLYDSLLKGYIDEQDASSLKTVALSADRKKLLFYRVDEPVGTTPPAYEIEFPDLDTEAVLLKLTGAVEGDIVTAKSDGSVKDSGIKITDVALKSEVSEEIMQKIAQSGHMKKEIVAVIPDAEHAVENVLYLVQDTTSTGRDKYEIYTKIGDEVILIDDTSLDLDGYVSTEELKNQLESAKSDAVATANQYTDEQISGVNSTVTTLSSSVKTNTSDILTLNSRADEHDTEILKLKASVGEGMAPIPDDDIRALFAAK